MTPRRKITTRRRRGDEAGFTLVEAVIAMVVFVVGVVGIANLFLIAGGQTNMANCMTAATAEASQTLDLLKAVHFDELRPGGSLERDDTDFHAYHSVRGVGKVRLRWVIESASASPVVWYITVEAQPLSSIGGNAGKATFRTFRAKTL